MIRVICHILLLQLFSMAGAVNLCLAAEMDVLHGEVMHMDNTMQSMVVRLDTMEDDGRLVTVEMSNSLQLDYQADGDENFSCIAQGKHVRIWGAIVEGNQQQFIAKEIRACGMASCTDPTGVRSRLSRKRQGKDGGNRCR